MSLTSYRTTGDVHPPPEGWCVSGRRFHLAVLDRTDLGLYHSRSEKNEKRWALTVGLSAGLLFILGAVLAYFVLAYAFDFLLSIGDGTQVAALRGSDYFKFVFALILVFGVSFEVPLLTVLLNFAGVLSYQQLKEKRRYVILFMFVFAAFVTPGQDPVSMVLLALSLTLMMEIATQIARINDKRKNRRDAEWVNISDDEASSINGLSPLADPL